MKRNLIETSNVDTLISRMEAHKVYSEDALCRMSSESIVGEAIGRKLIKATGEKDEWGHRYYRLS